MHVGRPYGRRVHVLAGGAAPRPTEVPGPARHAELGAGLHALAVERVDVPVEMTIFGVFVGHVRHGQHDRVSGYPGFVVGLFERAVFHLAAMDGENRTLTVAREQVDAPVRARTEIARARGLDADE